MASSPLTLPPAPYPLVFASLTQTPQEPCLWPSFLSACHALLLPSSSGFPFSRALLAPSGVRERTVISVDEGPSGRCHVILGPACLGSVPGPRSGPADSHSAHPPAPTNLALSRLQTFHVTFSGLEGPLLFLR